MELLVFILLFLVFVYLLNQYLFSFWSRHGFKQHQPTFFFGDARQLLTMKESIGEFFGRLYNQYKDVNVIGIYMSYLPILVVNDPKLIQDILIKDFGIFHDRPMPVDEENDPLSGHLFSIAGQKWRNLRIKLSPTFTSGKLKGMFSNIKDCGQVLEDYLVKNFKNGVDVFDFRDLLARYSTNIISSVAFGIENDCINEPDHIFRRMGAKFFEPNFSNGFRNTMMLTLPKLFHKLKLRAVNRDVEEFVMSIINQTIAYRETNNVTRNDFMQLLIQLKNQGYVSADKEASNGEDKVDKTQVTKMKTSELGAQLFVFFVAGFETTSSAMSFCLFELARNPEIQRKAQDEIDKAFNSVGAEGITYDTLERLTYLEWCINETLRKYPSVPFLFRTCSKDYKINNSKLVIPKGTTVMLPIFGLQRDPAIYENPLEFKPERFAISATGSDHSNGLYYLPFGDGPRICIGMRMGKLTTKIGLAFILYKFKLELTDLSLKDKELTFHPKQGVLAPIEELKLKITPR